MKKWREERAKRKPAIEAQFAKLRESERGWNLHAPPRAQPEMIDVPNMPPLFVRPETDASSAASSRKSYYDRYGVRR